MRSASVAFSIVSEVADYLGEQVSHADAFFELSRNFDLHRLGNAEPVDARDIGCGYVRVADAGREGSDRAQEVHVAVRAEHDVAWLYHSGFEHDVLPDAVVYVEEARYALPFAELADDLLVGRDLLGMRGGLEVEGESELVGVPDLRILAHLFLKLEHDVRAAEVTACRPVYPAPYAVPDLHGMARGALHNLHYRRLAHCVYPLSQSAKILISYRGTT